MNETPPVPGRTGAARTQRGATPHSLWTDIGVERKAKHVTEASTKKASQSDLILPEETAQGTTHAAGKGRPKTNRTTATLTPKVNLTFYAYIQDAKGPGSHADGVQPTGVGTERGGSEAVPQRLAQQVTGPKGQYATKMVNEK